MTAAPMILSASSEATHEVVHAGEVVAVGTKDLCWAFVLGLRAARVTTPTDIRERTLPARIGS